MQLEWLIYFKVDVCQDNMGMAANYVSINENTKEADGAFVIHFTDILL